MLPPAAPSDVVVTWLKRTAMTKAKRGGFKDTSSDHLLFSILQGAHRAAGADLVEDIAVGQCHAPSPCYEARAAALAAGFHERVPVVAINRLCGSGLMAIRSISDSIARGDIEVGLAVGVESMSSKCDCLRSLVPPHDLQRAAHAVIQV
jgi:acetyl-CoA acyltransferase 1